MNLTTPVIDESFIIDGVNIDENETVKAAVPEVRFIVKNVTTPVNHLTNESIIESKYISLDRYLKRICCNNIVQEKNEDASSPKYSVQIFEGIWKRGNCKCDIQVRSASWILTPHYTFIFYFTLYFVKINI